MRPSALVAQFDDDGVERFRVTRPVAFDLQQAAMAMHAVVDPDLARRDARNIVGKSRVPAVLRRIAREGWPEDFRPEAGRVQYWRRWLVEYGVFSSNPNDGVDQPMTEVETRLPERAPTSAYRHCVLNQKGGVGKTGLAAGLAGALAERGRRVLMIDLDPQGHLTTEAFGLDDVEEGKPNFAQLLTREYDGKLEELIVRHSEHASGGVIDVVPTSTEMFLVVQKMYKGRGRLLEWTLDELLDSLPPGLYDHIGIDCPPSLDILTDNALVASHGVLIPVQPARTSVRALALLLEQVAVLEQELKLTPRDLLGLVPSVYRRPLSGIAKYVAPEIEAFATPSSPDIKPLPILGHLPLAAAVEEAWLQGTTVVDYVPKSPLSDHLRRIAIRLDVAAGLVDPREWDSLPALPSLTASKADPTKE